jgi:uroporphyrinogen-III decarboxylase
MAARHIMDSHAALAISKRPELVPREDYLDYMTFRRQMPPMLTEIFGPLPGLTDEWREQGAAPEELDFSAFRYRCGADGWLPVNTGWAGGYPEEILEETDDYIIARDRMGRRVKLSKKAATLPLPMDYPVHDTDDWLLVKPHYEFSEGRLAGDWQARAREHLAAGRVVGVSIPGGFDEPRKLMGEERLCTAYYDEPELVHDILRTIGDTACRVLEAVTAAVRVDQIGVHEDMAGRSGPLAGPRQVAEFIAPYYRRVWDIARERGARIFRQDSDGDMRPVIPAFLDAGINFMYPCEPAAGMDVVRIRECFGAGLALMGGVDKHVVRRSREEIAAELEYKIPPMVRTGGCVIALDHRIPNGTPLASYRFYLDKAWEIMEAEYAAL